MNYLLKVSSGCFIRVTTLSLILSVSVPRVHAQPERVQVATGSVAIVGSDSTAAFTATSFEKLLQGQLAGVKVTSADGAPGAAVDVLVRGINFIKGSNQPLYVLDGVVLNPVQQANRRAFWNDPTDYQMLQDPLLAINPMDIETIEVLKDVASTAIYGSLGANGVVLIKTKQRSTQGMKVSFSSGFFISTASKKLDVLGKAQYLDYMRAKGIPAAAAGDEMDWQKEAGRLAIGTNTYFAVEGLTKDRIAYMLSLSYRKQNGIVNGSGTDNLSIRLNLDNAVGQFGKVGMRTLITYNQTDMLSGVNLVGNNTIIKHLTLAAPYQYNSDFGSEDYLMGNPLSMIEDYDDLNREWRIMTNLYGEASIFRWLKAASNLGIDYRDSKRHRWLGKGFEKANLDNGIGMIGRSDMFGGRYNWDNTLTADLDAHYGHFVIQAGFSTNGNAFYDKIGEGYGLADAAQSARTEGIGMATTIFRGNYQPYHYMMLSGWGQLGWSFNQRYFVNATLRTDKYKTFSDSWDTYPAVSAAWDVKREKWMENLTLVSALKIRAGWGGSGIKYSDPYRYFPFENLNQEPDLKLDPATRPNIAFDTYWHADVTEINAGFDLGLFNNRLSLIVDYFDRKTKEFLDIVHTDVKTKAIDTPWSSLTEMDNSGWEFTANVKAVDNRDWKWDIGANLFFNKPVIRKANNDFGRWLGNSIGVINGVDCYATVFAEGQAPGLFYGLRSNGLLNDANFATAPAYYGLPVAAGNIRFAERTGDDNIDNADRTDIGDPNPVFSFGLNTRLQYRNFSLSASFYGNYGNKILNLNRTTLDNTGDGLITNVLVKAYTGAGKDFAAINSLGMGDVSLYDIEDGSFLRCSDITLGYRFNLGEKVNKYVKGLSLGLSVKNAFIFTSYSGYDPEVNSFASDITRYGIDCGSYPHARSFILRISATF